MQTFGEVAESIDQIMGVKAVWGTSSKPVMCFGARGNEILPAPMTLRPQTRFRATTRGGS